MRFLLRSGNRQNSRLRAGRRARPLCLLVLISSSHFLVTWCSHWTKIIYGPLLMASFVHPIVYSETRLHVETVTVITRAPLRVRLMQQWQNFSMRYVLYYGNVCQNSIVSAFCYTATSIYLERKTCKTTCTRSENNAVTIKNYRDDDLWIHKLTKWRQTWEINHICSITVVESNKPTSLVQQCTEPFSVVWHRLKFLILISPAWFGLPLEVYHNIQLSAVIYSWHIRAPLTALKSAYFSRSFCCFDLRPNFHLSRTEKEQVRGARVKRRENKACYESDAYNWRISANVTDRLINPVHPNSQL